MYDVKYLDVAVVAVLSVMAVVTWKVGGKLR